jgi:hypothetical protein
MRYALALVLAITCSTRARCLVGSEARIDQEGNGSSFGEAEIKRQCGRSGKYNISLTVDAKEVN